MARARRTEDPVDMVTLTLNLAEAGILMALTDRVGGNQNNSARKLTDRIGCALRGVGINGHERDFVEIFGRSDIYMGGDSLLMFHPDELVEV